MVHQYILLKITQLLCLLILTPESILLFCDVFFINIQKELSVVSFTRQPVSVRFPWILRSSQSLPFLMDSGVG